MKNLFRYMWLILIAAMVMSGSGCKKEPQLIDYSIRFKIDGVEKEYKYTFLANFGTSTSGKLVAFIGLASLNEDIKSERMEVRVNSPKSKGVDTYTNIGWTPDSPFASLQWQDPANSRLYVTDYASDNSRKVTISFTKVTSDHVEGTFNGTLVLAGVPPFTGPLTRSITDGKFFLRLSQ